MPKRERSKRAQVLSIRAGDPGWTNFSEEHRFRSSPNSADLSGLRRRCLDSNAFKAQW